MSDGTAPPAPPSSGESAAPLTPAPRPATAKRPAPAARPSKVKAYLVVGIIVSTLVLSGLIVVSLVRSRKPVKEVRNVAAEWANSFQKSKAAFKETFAIESKVWTKGEDLTSEDLEKIRAGLKAFRETSDKFHELNKLVLDQGKGPSKETQEMAGRLPELKLWILDAAAIVEGDKKPPDYGGLYIPMYRTAVIYDKTLARLKEIEKTREEIRQRNDAEEKTRIRKEISGLEEEFAKCRDAFNTLIDYVREGLATPDLAGKDLQDMEQLLKYANDADMARKQGRTLRSQLMD